MKFPHLCFGLYVSFLFLGGMRSYGQDLAHSISLGYTFSELKRVSLIPEGTGQSGTLHVAENPQGNSGASLAYDVSLPLGKIFYATSGVGLTWLRSDFIYSRRIYGLSCASCLSSTESERLGVQATYSNIYLRLPLSVSVPFSEKGKTYLKIGVDLMWQIKNQSTWDFLEITWLYQRQDSAWLSQVVQTERGQEGLKTHRLQRGVFLSIWNKVAIKNEVFMVEGSMQIGLNRMYKFPALKRFSYGLQVGYIIPNGN